MDAIPRQFEIQGHRGCRGLMPENTIAGFIKAIDLGVDTLELDVVVSKDRKLVVSHEPHFNPEISTAPNGKLLKSHQETNLFEMDYDEIKKYDVGQKGNPDFPEQYKFKSHKPLLSEVFQVVSDYQSTRNSRQVSYNIEIKSLADEYHKTQPAAEEFVDLLLLEIGNALNISKFTLQSFDFNVLRYLDLRRENTRKYSISVLIEPEDNNEIDFNLEKLGFKPDIWSPNFRVLSHAKVEYLHSLGIKVIPWTVNTEAEMDKIYAYGCDGLITDYPNRAIKYIKK
ncbi:MAG: glycerophosphodiester phosphodiesterase [Cytophagaceae bacterium BCCC1]|nr:MAG: glycerophosphodiester phosphodiesterase [Cytophagaceae bacterium BCCC1]